MSPRLQITSRFALLVGLLACVHAEAGAQAFTRITTGNPIVTDAVPAASQYTGCAWVDYDNDGDPDLYIVQQGLYRNNGGGSFTRIPSCPAGHAGSIGATWADMDNDGDPDLFLSGGSPNGSLMIRNEGGDVFTRIATGAGADSLANQGWGCAWGDYDGDGRVDLVVAAAFGFLGITTPNHLLHNEGSGLFTRLDTSVVCAGTGPYTIPSWNDVDDDGDPDLFIASGPVNGTLLPDYLYLNHGGVPGITFFTRITTGALATDGHDGQLYNWVDIDGDGDLDVYVTNYGGQFSGLVNDLYRNSGGVFTKLTAAQAGPIVTDVGHSLASVWADLDNDGDMDCLVTNDGEASLYYENDGAGFFARSFTSPLRLPGAHYGAAAADYDGDGDLDLYLHGITSTRALFRNDAPATNGWLEVRCVGTRSNRSALGARVQVIATIGGVRRRLVQQVSAQNSFGGHNPFELHFGLGDATVADSVRVIFPSGIERDYLGVPLRQRLTVLESTSAGVEHVPVSREVSPLGLRWLGANPARGAMRVSLTLSRAGSARVELVDPAGRVALERAFASLGTGSHVLELGEARGLAPGLYWVRARSAGREQVTRAVVLR